MHKKNLYIKSAENGFILSYEDQNYNSIDRIANNLDEVRAFLETHFNTVTIPVAMQPPSPQGT